MKVYIQIVNTLNGILQTGMIEESVVKGHEIQNALKHFGTVYGEITWNSDFTNEDVANHPRLNEVECYGISYLFKVNPKSLDWVKIEEMLKNNETKSIKKETSV